MIIKGLSIAATEAVRPGWITNRPASDMLLIYHVPSRSMMLQRWQRLLSLCAAVDIKISAWPWVCTQ